jgi:Na+/proline symporter
VTALDWVVIGGFLAVTMGVGVALARRGGKSTTEFFLSGRNLPWWLAGTSILATSLSCDTPLHVTKVIREQGLAGAWLYWSGLLFVPMVTFLFARLWRRAGVMTDCEFVELRYSGRVAAVQRFCMALFRLFIIQAITLGWVFLGMAKITTVMLDLPPTISMLGIEVGSSVAVVLALVALTVAYTAMSGLWGVVANDFIQFVVALGGSILLAVFAVRKVGGIEGLKAGLDSINAVDGHAMSFAPNSGDTGLGIGTFLVYCLVLGWASAEADGGGNKAQRFLSCRSEGHALAGSIWDIMVQNIIRNWPWYIVALVSLVLYPTMADHEMVYPRMIADLLPSGMRGLVVGSLFMAFLSTVSTHLNLAASYAVNDLYRRFFVRDRSDRHYMRVSRITILLFAGLVATLALSMTSVLEALKLKGELMSGLGLVVILRWYWHRINPWSEIAAMVTSIVTTLLVRYAGIGVEPVANLLGIDPVRGDLFPVRLLIIVVASASVMLTVTFLTRPSDPETLRRFFERVRPPGPGFRKVAAGTSVRADPLGPQLVNWALASVFVICGMLAMGKMLLGFPLQSALLVTVAAAVGWILLKRLRPGTPRGSTAGADTGGGTGGGNRE